MEHKNKELIKITKENKSEKIVEYYIGNSTKVFRRCIICGLILNFDDFKGTYKKSDLDVLGTWENEKLAIPCCGCFKIMEEYNKNKISKTLNKMFDSSDKCIFKLAEKIYNNLIRFEVIK